MGFEEIRAVAVANDVSVINDPLPPIGFQPAQIIERSFLSAPGEIPAFHHYNILRPKGWHTFQVIIS
jgi:hypothetical protein